jgi:hypothetical protein
MRHSGGPRAKASSLLESGVSTDTKLSADCWFSLLTGAREDLDKATVFDSVNTVKHCGLLSTLISLTLTTYQCLTLLAVW